MKWEDFKIDSYDNTINTDSNSRKISTDCPCNQSQPTNTNIRTNCCCKKSMIEALKLLCNTELANLVDFEKFAFLTNSFIVGARLVLLKIGSDEKDNLSNLDGKFKRFSPCNCDLIDIEGTAAYDVPLPVSVTDLAEQLTEFIKLILDLLGQQDGIIGTLVDILKAILSLIEAESFSEEILQAILDFLIKFFTTVPMVDKASLCSIDSIAFQIKYVDKIVADGATS